MIQGSDPAIRRAAHSNSSVFAFEMDTSRISRIVTELPGGHRSACFGSAAASARYAPRNFSWAYEMKVGDPDGHVLRFGSEPLKGKPLDPWHD